MNTKRRRQGPGSTGLIILLLALVSLIGLLTGILTHTLVSRQPQISQIITPGSTGAPTHSATSPASPGATPATATGTTPAITAKFQLSVSATPKTVAPGQQMTITVDAFTPDTHTPVVGLPCILRAPTDGSPSLLTSWPAGEVTDANGVVSWTLTAPLNPDGAYEVEAFAQTSKWSWKADTVVNVKAG